MNSSAANDLGGTHGKPNTMRRTVGRCLLYETGEQWRAAQSGLTGVWYPWRRRRAIIDNWSFSGDNFYSETYCARFPGHPTTATAKVKVDRPITIIVVSLRDTITITRYDRARLQIIVFVPGDRDGDRTTRFITIRRDTRTCRFLPQGRTIVCFFCFPRFVF